MIRPINAVTGAVLTAVSVFCIPLAHATTQDDQFLREVAAAGIQGPPDELIADGHAACDNYANGPAQIAQLVTLSNQGISGKQVSAMTVAGFRAYCPDKLASLH